MLMFASAFGGGVNGEPSEGQLEITLYVPHEIPSDEDWVY